MPDPPPAGPPGAAPPGGAGAPLPAGPLDGAARAGLIGALGIEFATITGTEVTGHLQATVEHHTPWGIVHGGLYATVVESAASLGASVALEARGGFAVGVSNHTDFLRPHRLGRLDFRAVPVQQGRTLQLWVVDITNGEGKLVARGQVRLFNQPGPG